jgi:hypothetical protein
MIWARQRHFLCFILAEKTTDPGLSRSGYARRRSCNPDANYMTNLHCINAAGADNDGA